jgi:type II restriction enzyme
MRKKMILELPVEAAAAYKSSSQKARVITEKWALDNIYCPACTCDRVTDTAANTEAVDFVCSRCDALFQLKASSKPIRQKVMDAGYDAMMRSIQRDALPHFFIMGYDNASASVTDLLLIPRFCLAQSAIEKRKPLAPTARRAGWVGCNILLGFVPPQGRIAMVHAGQVVPKGAVREKFRAIKPLAEIGAAKRGWTLDVLTAIRSLGKAEFTLDDAYSFEQRLSAMHPDNRNVQPKIRQQLQILRDMGYLVFERPGHYRWVKGRQ